MRGILKLDIGKGAINADKDFLKDIVGLLPAANSGEVAELAMGKVTKPLFKMGQKEVASAGIVVANTEYEGVEESGCVRR
jgi:hypothetical protein